MVTKNRLYATISAVALASILFISLVPTASSTEVETVNVSAGEIRTMTLNLRDGATVSGSFSVTGGSGDDIDFWVTDPSGNHIISERRITRGDDFSFRASDNGAYTIHFDNSFSLLSTKQVRLSYDVQNPIIPAIGGGGGGGCLIATAAFGSELTPQVQFLRDFRDNRILSTASGASFMTAFNSWYYSFSPQVADFERQQPWMQQTVKTAIYPLLGILHLAEGAYSVIPGEYGSITAGIVASSLIGAVYASPLVLSIKQVRRFRPNYKLALAIIAVAALAVAISLSIANESALIITTSILVVATLAIAAVLSANTLARIIEKRKRANQP